MISRRYAAYAALIAVIVGSLAVPKGVRNRIRMNVIGAFSKERAVPERESLLQAENTALKRQLAVVREWLSSEDQLDQLREGRIRDLNRRLDYHGRAICASVVFREPAAWSSYIWIDRGQGQVAVNSPVLTGDAVVGVVEEVGASRARVRLITDGNLCPSVQGPQAEAKGQLHGSSAPIWRTQATLLKGVGFTTKGRHFRPGDLLVTTGFDGVFPAGLKVATVTKVYPPHASEVTYALEARPIAPKLHDLHSVQVLPPL